MRRLIWFVMVSIDGYYEAPGHDISWHVFDNEQNAFSVALLDEVDTLLFGRIAYELMAGYWPTATTDHETARRMNNLNKVVFSRTLQRVDWQHARLVQGDAAEEVARLKQEPGKDMVVGSGKLATLLAQQGLVDEYRIIISPVALGSGSPIFQGLPERLNLTLRRTRVFANGNVLLVYAP